MDVNDDFRLEEELFGSEGGRESAGEWSSDAPQEIVAKQTRNRPREPTMKIEEMKKTGCKGKAEEGPAGWVRPLYPHDENNYLVRCSPPSSATTARKKGDYITCLICHQKVSSTNTTGRLHSNAWVNTTFRAQAISRQLCSWQSSAGRKGGTSQRKGFPSLGLATPRGDLKHGRLQTTRSEGASVCTQEGQWHTAGCEGLWACGLRRTASPMPLLTRLHFEPCYARWTCKPQIWAKRVWRVRYAYAFASLLHFRLLLFHLIFLWLMLRVLLHRSHGCIIEMCPAAMVATALST